LKTATSARRRSTHTARAQRFTPLPLLRNTPLRHIGVFVHPNPRQRNRPDYLPIVASSLFTARISARLRKGLYFLCMLRNATASKGCAHWPPQINGTDERHQPASRNRPVGPAGRAGCPAMSPHTRAQPVPFPPPPTVRSFEHGAAPAVRDCRLTRFRYKPTTRRQRQTLKGTSLAPKCEKQRRGTTPHTDDTDRTSIATRATTMQPVLAPPQIEPAPSMPLDPDLRSDSCARRHCLPYRSDRTCQRALPTPTPGPANKRTAASKSKPWTR